ncbi:MAG: hypothetical protein JOZ39_13160 [Chloroflexi bacterium]|nr:hypothetical protein [Chloroflexota bacterium]
MIGEGVIARFFALLDGRAPGRVSDVLADDFQFELALPGSSGSPPSRVAGGKAQFVHFLSERPAGNRGTDILAYDRHDGLEMVVGRTIGSRFSGTTLAAVIVDGDGNIKRLIAAISSVDFEVGGGG